MKNIIDKLAKIEIVDKMKCNKTTDAHCNEAYVLLSIERSLRARRLLLTTINSELL